jgi:selenide, water dikinase
VLDQILAKLPRIADPNVLVSTDDDAGVYQVAPGLAIVQTVDFFTPVVDDPFDFGAIAAANAISDIYAMGATPITAMNLIAFPKDGDLDVLGEIIRGGAEKAQEAGISIIGGHSIDDREPKYGMAVTGVVHPDRIARKAGARPGDRLVLTKPLGTGIITTAIKAGRAGEEVVRTAVRHMKTLNRAAAEAMAAAGITGATDITGFGLLGHLHEMLHRSGVSARLSVSDVPVMDGVRELARFSVPGGSRANLRYVADKVQWDPAISEDEKLILADAQTSGGMLIAVSEERLPKLLAGLQERGVQTRAVIGMVIEGDAGKIIVER